MKSTWNLVGYAIWLLLIIYLVWMVHDMRVRRIKQIVTEKKSFSWRNFTISSAELIGFLVVLWGMAYITIFQGVGKLDDNAVTTSYSYKPLVLEYNSQSYYVRVKTGNGRKPMQHYRYFVAGEKYAADSNNATVVAGKNNTNVEAQTYKWDQQKLNRLDVRYQKAWVATVTTTYKKNFMNGIGLHAGRLANRFSLIRIPDKSFMSIATSAKQ